MAQNQINLKNNRCFRKDNMIYVIPRKNHEITESLIDRVNFIMHHDRGTDTEELVNLSNVWINKEFLGCEYGMDIERKIQKLENQD